MSSDNDMEDGHNEPTCEICGRAMERESCWQCHGEGGFHDCGEDCCMCLDKEEITEDCDECDGEGSYWQCMHLPHTDEQMLLHKQRTAEPLAGKANE